MSQIKYTAFKSSKKCTYSTTQYFQILQVLYLYFLGVIILIMSDVAHLLSVSRCVPPGRLSALRLRLRL